MRGGDPTIAWLGVWWDDLDSRAGEVRGRRWEGSEEVRYFARKALWGVWGGCRAFSGIPKQRSPAKGVFIHSKRLFGRVNAYFRPFRAFRAL